jgi:hypothetical protein
MLRTPADFVAHFERYASSVVSIVGFGRRIGSTTDPIITKVIALMQAAAHVAVTAKDFPRLMDSFPCMWLHLKILYATVSDMSRDGKAPQLDDTVERAYIAAWHSCLLQSKPVDHSGGCTAYLRVFVNLGIHKRACAIVLEDVEA